MGSPISNIVAEIFIHLENTHLKHILEAKTIPFYTRYVDDTLMIYNAKHTTPEKIRNLINKIHPNLQFTPTHEYSNTISFLDLLLIRHPDKIETDIFRKPTTTDTTINYTSNHPTEHKMAAFHYLIHRMMSLPLTTERKKTDWQTILPIVKNNFPLHLLEKMEKQIQNKTPKNNADKNKKWAIFTYHSPLVRKITNLFKHTDIKIAFKTTNTIQQQPRPKSHETIPD
jgi:hypothetical protein